MTWRRVGRAVAQASGRRISKSATWKDKSEAVGLGPALGLVGGPVCGAQTVKAVGDYARFSADPGRQVCLMACEAAARGINLVCAQADAGLVQDNPSAAQPVLKSRKKRLLECHLCRNSFKITRAAPFMSVTRAKKPLASRTTY